MRRFGEGGHLQSEDDEFHLKHIAFEIPIGYEAIDDLQAIGAVRLEIGEELRTAQINVVVICVEMIIEIMEFDEINKAERLERSKEG